MTEWSPELIVGGVVAVIGALAAAIVKILLALKELRVKVDGGLEKMLKLTETAYLSVGREQARAEMVLKAPAPAPTVILVPAPVAVPTLAPAPPSPLVDPNGDPLVVQLPTPTPTVVLMPSEELEKREEG